MWLPDDGFMWTKTCWNSFYNFNYFNNLRILLFVCISWTIKCLILLMRGATMKLILEWNSRIHISILSWMLFQNHSVFSSYSTIHWHFWMIELSLKYPHEATTFLAKSQVLTAAHTKIQAFWAGMWWMVNNTAHPRVLNLSWIFSSFISLS
jgi:hypothetical protein